MALNDITPYDDGVFSENNAKLWKVVASSNGPASIKAGELVLVGGLGAGTAKAGAATRWGTSVASKPSVGTDYIAGLAMTTSTETATVAGTIAVMPITGNVTFLGNPDTAATWNTQAKYDALVGSRVKLSTSSTGVQTILATDSFYNALVVESLNITAYPGKVRFSINPRVMYNG